MFNEVKVTRKIVSLVNKIGSERVKPRTFWTTHVNVPLHARKHNSMCVCVCISREATENDVRKRAWLPLEDRSSFLPCRRDRVELWRRRREKSRASAPGLLALHERRRRGAFREESVDFSFLPNSARRCGVNGASPWRTNLTRSTWQRLIGPLSLLLIFRIEICGQSIDLGTERV